MEAVYYCRADVTEAHHGHVKTGIKLNFDESADGPDSEEKVRKQFEQVYISNKPACGICLLAIYAMDYNRESQFDVRAILNK